MTSATLETTPRPRARWGLRLLFLAVVQTAVLGWLLWDRVSILTAPTEIRLTPQPVDPRDLFRGDYVILRYGISTPPRDLVDGLDIKRGDPLWVTISPAMSEPDRTTAPNADATAPAAGEAAPTPPPAGDRSEQTDWRITEISLTEPAEQPHAPEFILRGIAAQPDAWSIDYGIEWYFVPEGEGKELETRIGDRALSVLVAVTHSGKAAIKALIVDGDTVYVEPLL